MTPVTRQPLRICLYVAIPSHEQNLRFRVSLYQHLKRFVARCTDIFSWSILNKSSVRFHHWQSIRNTNKGDMAIRETIKAQLREAFAPRPVTFQEFEWGTLKESMAERLNGTCDLLVIGGSGYIRWQDNGDAPPALVEDDKLYAQLQFPVVAYGIGWNRLISENENISMAGVEHLKQLLRKLTLVSVRDARTAALVERISGSPPALIGDPALFFADLFPGAPARSRAKRIQVGLNMAIHGQASAERIGQEFDRYCAFLKSLAREHDVTFHYVQHSHTERVIPLMLAARGIFVQRHDPPPESLTDFYRGLDIHICQMMHSSVLSLGAGVPTINFGYDIKNQGLFDLMGLTEFYFSSWNFDHDAALTAARKLIAERQPIAAAIHERSAELRTQLNAFLKRIKAEQDGRALSYESGGKPLHQPPA